MYNPGLQAKESIHEAVDTMLTVLPEQLGIPEIIAGCEVTDLDPTGAGVAIPRYIEVRIQQYKQLALWRGSPTVAVGEEVTVVHYREGNRYEVTSISGDSGIVTEGNLYLSHWVYDVSEGLLIPYTTINGALGYGLLASGDYVLIHPGTFNEAITLVDGVIITEMIPGSVILDRTGSDTCVTAADGGYIQVKEIKCTRTAANDPAPLDISGLGAGESCEVRAELIKGENAPSGGGAIVYGVKGGGSGTAYIYADVEAESVGFGTVRCISFSDDTIYVFGDVNVSQSGNAATVYAVYCNSGSGSLYIRGHIDVDALAGSDIRGIRARDSATVRMWGDISVTAIGGGAGGFIYCIEFCNDIILYGNVRVSSDASGTVCYGIYASDTGTDEYSVFGRIIVATSDATAIETDGVLVGSGTVRTHGDVSASGAGGNRYGVRCVGGTCIVTHGRISGDTTDLIRAAGTLSAFMLEYDTYSGTITSYYPLTDDDWIGIAGGAGARFVFDSTPAPDEINMENANLVVDDDAFVGLGSVAGRFSFDDTPAPDEISILDANLVVEDDAWLGLGSAAGRLSFDDTPAPDEISVLDANVVVEDDAWIGLGSAAGRFSFDSTPAPDEISILDANVVMEDDAWIGLGSAAGRIAFDDQATDEVLISDAYLGINVDPPLARVHSVETGGTALYGVDTGAGTGVTGQAGVNGTGVQGYAGLGGLAGLFIIADNITNTVAEAMDYTHVTSGAAAAGFGLATVHRLEDAGGGTQDASEDVTLWADATAGSESPLKRWTTCPIAIAGPGYMGFWTWNDLDNTARTVIPNTTGDVTGILTIQYAVSESGGGTSGGTATVTPGNTVDIYDDGTDVFTVTCNADGSVEIARSAGASTADVALTMTWV